MLTSYSLTVNSRAPFCPLSYRAEFSAYDSISKVEMLQCIVMSMVIFILALDWSLMWFCFNELACSMLCFHMIGCDDNGTWGMAEWSDNACR